MLTDDPWGLLAPHVERAKRFQGGNRPVVPDRLFFEAVLYRARTGVPWRDLPGEFGSWDAVYRRFARWVRSGSLKALFESLTADPDLGNVRRTLIDATAARAHPHAAGARRKRKRSGRHEVLAVRALAAAAVG